MNHEIKDIKQLRKNLSLTQKELSDLAGVSQSLIAKIESGLIEPTYSKAMQIFSALENFHKKDKLTAKDLLNNKIKFISPDDSIKKAAKIMSRYEISQLPVILDDKILGLVSESTLLKHIFDNKELLVEEIMEEIPPIISSKTNIEIISNSLLFYPLVIVQEKGKYIGIITKSDIISKKFRKQ